MQKGFATLEIIFVLLIIGVLLSVAVPNAARILDRAALDYETKRLYSDLRFLQALSRSGEFSLLGTGRSDLQPEKSPYMQIYSARRSWKIFRDNKSVRAEHVMNDAVKFKDTNSIAIRFDAAGKSNQTSKSIILRSRYGKTNKIVFDSVGRFRGGREDD